MAMKKLDKPIPLFRADLEWFDGSKCLKEAKIAIVKMVAVEYDTKSEEFIVRRDDESQVRYHLSIGHVAHFRDKATCPTFPEKLWWPSPEAALVALRSRMLKQAKGDVVNAKESIARTMKEKDEVIGDAEKEIMKAEEHHAECKEDLVHMTKLFTTFAMTKKIKLTDEKTKGKKS